jgi:hypothetical protein
LHSVACGGLVEKVKLASGEFENCGGPDVIVTEAEAAGTTTSHATAIARSPDDHLRPAERADIEHLFMIARVILAHAAPGRNVAPGPGL